LFRNHPKGLRVLFFTEMWERFGYYLIIGILVLYMTDQRGLQFDTGWANEIYGWFIALVYLTPFAGGIIADQYLGYRKAVILGGTLMAIGYLGLGFLPGLTGFYASLAVVIVGNGFFKPNISAIVGRLYPAGSPLKDAGYNIFYMGINIGAFACNFVAAILRNRFGWGWAFAAAGVGMAFGVVWFVMNQKPLEAAADRGDGSGVEPGILMKLSLSVFLPAVAAGGLGFFASKAFGLQSYMPFFTPANTLFVCAVIPVIGYFVSLWVRARADEKGPIAALLSIFAVVVVFWMIFHQNGNTLTLWARDNTNREAGMLTPALKFFFMDEVATDEYWKNVAPEQRPAGETSLVSTEIFQSINPFFVVVLTPLVVWFFGWLRVRKLEPSTPAKIAWGLAITALSTLVMVAAVMVTHGGLTRASGWWLIGTYGVITVGELFLSPMGLSLVSRLAPTRYTALMMGGWFLSTSLGNKLAGVIGGLWEKIPLAGIFWINFACALAAAGLIALMVPWIRRVMASHETAGH